MQAIFDFAIKQTLSFTLIIVMILFTIIWILSKFDIEFDGFKPVFKRHISNKILEFEEKLKFAQVPDFIKKTENGEYIGYFVAKKPYIIIWADGNWNSEEHYHHFDKLSRLWENENEIIIYGKNPNLPSDLNYIIEKKAKKFLNLNIKLTIYCSFNVADYLKKYYKDYNNVEIIGRG